MKRLAAVLLLGLLAACGGSGSMPSAAPAVAFSDPYQAGPYEVTTVTIAEGQQGAPRGGLLFAPQSPGRYPLIQFQHGFSSSVDSYPFMLGRLASHGFVVFAPQMYAPGNPANSPGIPEEVQAAADVSAWLKSSVNVLLQGAQADPALFGIAGHSRGGQVAWRLLSDAGVPAQALAGVDPVDGNAPPFSNDTGPLVTAMPLRFGFPVHVLGTGLGALGGPLACAPEVRNYQKFVDAQHDAVYAVLADEHGHADMTDSNCLQCRAACVSNPSAGMPEFTAGQLVAYFSWRLKGAQEALGYLTDLSTAPVAASAHPKP